MIIDPAKYVKSFKSDQITRFEDRFDISEDFSLEF